MIRFLLTVDLFDFKIVNDKFHIILINKVMAILVNLVNLIPFRNSVTNHIDYSKLNEINKRPTK